MPCRQCRPLAGDRCQIAEPKPGSSGRMSCKLALSRAQRPPRLPLDARRAAPLPRPPRQRHRLSGSAQVPRACCRAGNHPGAGPSSRPGPCGHPQTDRRAGFCHCGCGGRTSIIAQTQASRGRFAGEYSRYIKGHNRRKTVRYIKESTGFTTPCWIWQLAKTHDGYGLCSDGTGKMGDSSSFGGDFGGTGAVGSLT